MDETELNETAELCHELNRAYCQSIGDNSQLPWCAAPQWQKDSTINGVKFHIANPNSKPSDSHESWLKEKKKAGWKYGDIKNPDKKEHPCFVPFDKLPQAQQLKDVIFLTAVRAAENMIGKPEA